MGRTFFQRSDTYKRLNKVIDPKDKSQQQLEGRVGSPLKPSSSDEQIQQKPQLSAYEQELEQRHREIQQQKLQEKLRLQQEAAAKGEVYIDTDEQQPKPRIKRNKEEDEEKRKSKIPKALYDPEVRKQLEELKQHKPIFMYTVTIIQILLMIICLIINYRYTGNLFDNMQNNIMLGPNYGVLIHMGARFVPCMKQMDEARASNYTINICPRGVKGSIVNDKGYINSATRKLITENLCSRSELCGMGGFEDTPNQWIRFIVPIFLHCGIIHIIINLIFQIRTGIQMERDFGTWRMMIIYMASGIFGFAFGADISYAIPSVGCSGALYGLLGCLLLDLVQNWKLIVNPFKELIKMLFIIIFSFGIGLIPFVDNFAHVGGFITGIFSGLIFMPTIIFGKWDLRRKRFLMVISIPILIGMFVWVFKAFYQEDKTSCKWCKYITCVPINHWCDRL
ncbi:rhomboid-domain-containing protein [Piromyces finnis]|uniref:Rhomboid-type serine protease n=1 Tax=Piromyces finnis TaxID=1754191 RepID=A0A1Y1VKF4_9FUNG|nr:rhomboid-domain-containing protein [Piromyces finnis]|eukprot:ORX57858.1 rhomboid-domain-containing protein [Piromyces finnis]